MALDQGGFLSRAASAARQATALARTPAEAYAATETLALVECNRGHHAMELIAARRLMALDPGRERSLLWLRRAARCNGLASVEQKVNRELAARTAPFVFLAERR
jgi:hypothetical protein